jgi:hypothetical protein
MMFVLLKRKHFGLRKGRGEERERRQKGQKVPWLEAQNDKEGRGCRR